jgi:hypothetical protein
VEDGVSDGRSHADERDLGNTLDAERIDVPEQNGSAERCNRTIALLTAYELGNC